MKKIFFILCCVLGIVACSSAPLPLPETQNGVFAGNPTYEQAEVIVYDACTKARWQIIDKQPGFITINFDHGDFNFTSEVQFTNSRYSIIFKSVNRDDGSTKEAYAIYKKYAIKLNKVIQKIATKRIR